MHGAHYFLPIPNPEEGRKNEKILIEFTWTTSSDWNVGDGAIQT